MATGQAEIIVPLDGSKNAEKALPLAISLSRAWAAPLLLLHVVDDGERSGPLGIVRTNAVFEAHAGELMARLGADVAFHAMALDGAAADTILAVATGGGERKAARAIVIASHGRSGLRATVIGSVADRVVRNAPVPVLVVPGIDEPRPADGRPVVVALDGSETAIAGLPPARALAAALGSPLVLVQAVQFPLPLGQEYAYYPPDLLDELKREAADYLRALAEAGESIHIVDGTASTAIVRESAELDAAAVVVTSTGKGLAKRIALGSTTDGLLHHLHRPLFVVPAGYAMPEAANGAAAIAAV